MANLHRLLDFDSRGNGGSIFGIRVPRSPKADPIQRVAHPAQGVAHFSAGRSALFPEYRVRLDLGLRSVIQPLQFFLVLASEVTPEGVQGEVFRVLAMKR
jgi:hypothetical protein